MRYINIADIQLPDGWKAKAEQALHELVNASDATTRKEIIRRRSDLWSEMKSALEALSSGKCWYCESREGRSDNAVDHFRPKNNVVECAEHEGYWWLAFDWRNYRFCCTFCNSRRTDTQTGTTGGKHDHFPLINEQCRARQMTDDIGLEEPCLLDPTNPDDPALLWYDSKEGRAVPAYAKKVDALKYKRAEVSIQLYHLNHTKIKENRIKLFNDIKVFVTLGTNAWDRIYEYGADNNAYENFALILKKLDDLLSPDAELSAVTQAYLTELVILDDKGQYSWIENTLLTRQDEGSSI